MKNVDASRKRATKAKDAAAVKKTASRKFEKKTKSKNTVHLEDPVLPGPARHPIIAPTPPPAPTDTTDYTQYTDLRIAAAVWAKNNNIPWNSRKDPSWNDMIDWIVNFKPFYRSKTGKKLESPEEGMECWISYLKWTYWQRRPRERVAPTQEDLEWEEMKRQAKERARQSALKGAETRRNRAAREAEGSEGKRRAKKEKRR